MSVSNPVKEAQKYRQDLKSEFIPDIGFVESHKYLELLDFVEKYGAQQQRKIDELTNA